jgi:effector-binding domain-containing protein
MGYDIAVIEVPERTVLAKRERVRVEGIGPMLQRTFGALYEHIARSAVQPSGEPFVIYHTEPAAGGEWEIEVCAPVSDVLLAPPGYAVHTIPGGSVASAVHVGPYDRIGAAYDEIRAFIRMHELDPAGPPREVYLTGPEVPPSETRTRVEFPVARVPLVV